MIHRYLLSLFALISIGVSAQNNDNPRKHEIKANAFNLIVFKSPEFSYEYLIDSESSFGASILFNLYDREEDDFLDGPYYNEKFALTPYYRRYFSSWYASGFFLEAFGMYNIQEDYDGFYDIDLDREVFSNERSNNIAFGIALGGKFTSSKGFAFEFYGGVGRNIVTSDNDIGSELVPRLGVSLGYRF
ncbi:DUF3575 domain-containing protein [Flavobacteriaceae bacterium TP-CH-4]|uniref:DUF3575 domain-containing protein n=1 Tax=Pelagihabitans pacificus TaxID=2696054 RepID=A0A967AX93_9FLAO|nr:DUF3575 domain-containing protein [Pelagihabitans pacificus]NHF58271.1 DUF3575 domain-containing protein [Pelagihabitans pacificus]